HAVALAGAQPLGRRTLPPADPAGAGPGRCRRRAAVVPALRADAAPGTGPATLGTDTGAARRIARRHAGARQPSAGGAAPGTAGLSAGRPGTGSTASGGLPATGGTGPAPCWRGLLHGAARWRTAGLFRLPA